MAETGASMRAVIMERLGKARVLKPTRLPRPQPAPGEALVKVQATSVNPTDLLLRSGRLIIRKPLPHILGADLAGTIEALGEDVARLGYRRSRLRHLRAAWLPNRWRLRGILRPAR